MFKKLIQKKSVVFITLLVLFLIILSIYILTNNSSNSKSTKATNEESKNDSVAANSNSITTIASTTDETGNLIIDKNSIQDGVSEIIYNYNGTNMGILIVKTGDKISTVFDTCQVCNGSPRAYFKKVNNTLVCQNCQNSFLLNEVGEEYSGCNPIPILDKDKTVTDSSITITKDYLSKYVDKFKIWKKI